MAWLPATSVVVENLEAKIAAFRRHNIDVCCGGSLFELAVRRDKKRRVTSITKSNAQGFGMVLWDRTFQMVAAEFPGIETESLLVDAAAMNFIRRPESFDVVVGSNLFGALVGGLLELLSGWTGIKSLLLVAALLYLASYLTLRTRQPDRELSYQR